MIEKKKITVTINGQQYTISGRENIGHISEVANFVDRMMVQMKKTNPYLDKTQLAVLTAVNLADQYLKLKAEVDSYKKKDGDL
ncbi:MAG: cell division protein ZapA [Bacillaceae bacterium]|nr:cell division protein ZapA [Bacillaceae bacterium]